MPSASIANPLYFLSGQSGTTSLAENQVRLADVMEFFFVAHPSSGMKEGEGHRRIMYFSPKYETLDRQTAVTGFAEAAVNFTNNFVDPRQLAKNKSEFPFRNVSTEKTEQVYIQLENEEFLFGISLLKSNCDAYEYTISSAAVRVVLINMYKMFRLFFGNLTPFRKNKEEKFKERLEYFFSRYIPLLKLQKMPLLDLLEGAAFLPLAGHLYLNIVTLTSELTEEFPFIEKVLVLYQNKLLFYTTSARDVPSLFRYLTHNLLPMAIGPELEPTRTATQGHFLRGPTDLTIDAPLEGEDALPTVFLHSLKDEEDEETLDRYQMMVYRSLNATMCLFVRNDVMTRRQMRNIDGFLGSELARLASDIGESIDAQSTDLRATTDFHYIYFNPASLSMTSSFESRGGGATPPTPPVEVNRLMCDTMKTFFSNEDEFGECFVKSESEWWIVLKKMNSRLLCLLLPPSSNQHSLADVQSRAQIIIKSHFEAIFFN